MDICFFEKSKSMISDAGDRRTYGDSDGANDSPPCRSSTNPSRKCNMALRHLDQAANREVEVEGESLNLTGCHTAVWSSMAYPRVSAA